MGTSIFSLPLARIIWILFKMTIPTTLIVVLMTTILMTGAQNPSYRRCYSCRSRGELGDCKDDFIPPPPFNASNPGASLQRHVQESPCFRLVLQADRRGHLGQLQHSRGERLHAEEAK